MLATVVAALTEMMRAVNAGDAAAYARLYAPDAVIEIYGGDVLRGRAAIEQYEIGLLREFPGTRLAFYAVWEHGHEAIVHYAVNGRTPAGREMGHAGLLFYRFQPSGLIERERRYLDSFTPMAQLGAFGSAAVRPPPAPLPTEMKPYVSTGSATEAGNVALVRSIFAATDAKDYRLFASSIGPNTIIDENIHADVVVGARNVRPWFDRWANAAPDAKSEISTILGVGDYVLVEVLMRGTMKGRVGLVPGSNRPFAIHRAAIVEVVDKTIARLSYFMNGKELAEAVGQWPLR